MQKEVVGRYAVRQGGMETRMLVGRILMFAATILVTSFSQAECATAPEQINYQAKVEANGMPFDGIGNFKFAIVDQSGSNTYWSNDGSSGGGSMPSNAVALNVSGGLLNVMLGNASYPNMNVLPASVFLNPDTWLRVWFAGTSPTNFERLAPDSKLASVPYAMVAETVPDASITGEKLARESVQPQHEGRGDCIVSYFCEYSGANAGTNIAIPTNKNFIITDVVFGNVDIDNQYCSLDVRYSKDGQTTVLFRQRTRYFGTGATFVYPIVVGFRSGMVVPAGATLTIGGYAGTWAYWQSCTLSGFEIPVE